MDSCVVDRDHKIAGADQRGEPVDVIRGVDIIQSLDLNTRLALYRGALGFSIAVLQIHETAAT